MADFTVAEVCTATKGLSRGGMEGARFQGVCTDTRTVQPGNLFIALTGERFDGHEFIRQAIEKGAAGVVISKQVVALPEGIAVIVVENTLKALQDLAQFHRRRFQIPVIVITGSNGKTTTKDLTAAILASKLRVLKTEANFNNEIGLPRTLLNMTSEHQVAVVEMGMRGPGEIDELAKIAEPTAGIVTNVGETHIELLGSLDNIAAAKAELVEAVPPEGFVALNADNKYVQAMSSKASGRVILYGMNEPCQVQAYQIETEGLQTSFMCRCHGVTFPLSLPMVGLHNVYNTLAAVAVAWELGLRADDIQMGLAHFQPSSMRQQIERVGEYVIINDAYNASPLSMAGAIATLQQVAAGRSIAVLGDMLELGEVAVEAHRRIGQTAGQCGVDAVVTVGPLAAHIAAAAREAGVKETLSYQKHDEAGAALQRILQPGDTILLKGSRGMKMEKILEMLG